MSNQHYDVAFHPACDLGIEALHGRAPDEILMAMEEAMPEADDDHRRKQAACLMGLIMAVTWRAQDVTMIRDRVAAVAAQFCPQFLPKENLWEGREAWRLARQALARCPAYEWEPDAGRVMLALLLQRGWKAREVGLHALCFIYAYQQDESLRPKLARSFETIGRAIGLTALNQRSAISAAMQRGPLELARKMQRTRRQDATIEFWFMKREDCREALRTAMMGKTNRHGSASDAAMIETLHGVPVKQEFAGMSSKDLRRYFDGLENARCEGI